MGAGGVEDDVGGVPRFGAGTGLQDVRRLLRRRVAGGELVLEMRAHQLGDDGDADEGQDPQTPAPSGGGRSKPGQPPERGRWTLRRRPRDRVCTVRPSVP